MFLNGLFNDLLKTERSVHGFREIVLNKLHWLLPFNKSHKGTTKFNIFILDMLLLQARSV